MAEDFDNEIYKAYLAGLSAADQSDLIHSWHMPDKSDLAEARRNLNPHIYHVDLLTNRTVNDKFGQDVDQYLRKTYAEYNQHTQVVIVTNPKSQTHQYIHFIPDDIDPSLIKQIVEGRVEFQRIISYSGAIYLAYAPEIDTLFVRTLFKVTPTKIDPNDKLDMDAKLGL